jgi:hypothetical protein
MMAAIRRRGFQPSGWPSTNQSYQETWLAGTRLREPSRTRRARCEAGDEV